MLADSDLKLPEASWPDAALLPVHFSALPAQLCALSWTNLMGVALDWDADCAPQSQVCNFEALRLIVHQQVLGLQVPVHHAMLVHVSCSFDQLVHEALQAVVGSWSAQRL